MNYLYNNQDKNILRKNLRKKMPFPEVLLWKRIRGKQLSGLKFRRQYSIGSFILDFYCAEKRIAVELDGESHYDIKAIIKDEQRDNFLRSKNIKVLRFTNIEVMENVDGVIENILNLTTSLNPSCPRRETI